MARRPLGGLRVRHLMIGVAVLALGLFLCRGLWDIVEHDLYFPSSAGILSPGEPVITVGDHRDGTAVSSGTPCVVESDLAVDLDDCFDRRIITVKVMAGHNQGAIIEIPRRLLRKR